MNSPVASLSKRKIAQNTIFVLLCAFIAGITGVLTAALMFWMAHQKIAQDDHLKHGISHQKASRLGGLAVAICAAVIYWIYSGLPLELLRVTSGVLANPISYATLIGLVGLYDDVNGHLSARIRLVLTTLVFAAWLLLNLDYIPSAIGIPLLDSVLQITPIAFLLCLLACVALLNATNMADGANGLMPLVFMGTFYAYALMTSELIYLALTMALMVFTLFNVLSGKLFLGDAGSYGLGALAALGAVKIISETEAEVWLFLCLAAYPIIDFLVSVTRRKVAGRSPLSPDSDHMHNRLYRYVRGFISSPLVANSISGLTISIATTGIAVVLLRFWAVDSNYWIALFACIVAIYLVAYSLLPTNEPKTSE